MTSSLECFSSARMFSFKSSPSPFSFVCALFLHFSNTNKGYLEGYIHNRYFFTCVKVHSYICCFTYQCNERFYPTIWGEILFLTLYLYNGRYFKLFIIHVSLPEKFSDLQTFLHHYRNLISKNFRSYPFYNY